jgi:hypothetical protein
MIAEVNALSESNVILVQDPSQIELASYGIQGPRGFSLLSGIGEPTTNLGINQDLYMDLHSSFLYKKLAGVWVYQTYVRAQQKRFDITAVEVAAKQITLSPVPNDSGSVTLEFLGAGGQENGVDFGVSGDVLSWNGKGLDGFIESGDIIIVRY